MSKDRFSSFFQGGNIRNCLETSKGLVPLTFGRFKKGLPSMFFPHKTHISHFYILSATDPLPQRS